MLEQIKQIPAKLLELWKKYTVKQRTIFLSIVGTLIIVLVILIAVLGRTSYVKLATFENTSSAGKVLTALNTAGIAAKVSDDNLTIYVDSSKRTDASMALFNAIPEEEDLNITELLTNSLETTNADRRLKNDLYTKFDIIEVLEKITGVEDANVVFYPTSANTSILTSNQDIACSVMLIINSDFDTSNVTTIARSVALSLGNQDTDDIVIIDQYANALFGGLVDEETEANNKKEQYITWVNSYYKDILWRGAIMNHFASADIGLYLDINFDETSILYTEYLAADGQDQGLYDTYYKYSSENKTSSGDVPGTDSNDEVDYYIADTSTGNSSEDELSIKYLPSTRVTQINEDSGVIDRTNSSIGITLNKVTDVSEDNLRLLGELDNITFDEYIAQNSSTRRMDLSEYEFMYDIFAMASGIATSNIQIVAYETYNFIASEGSNVNWSLILQIVLAAVIIGLLLFVVFKGMAPEKVVELEPELSVEQLLATTKENQSLEDIELSEKSETRRMIEKFVDENPEAVANLMRNWLNDEWG